MFVNKGDSIMTILPLSDNRMSGEMKVPIAEVSQMDLKGQQIRITFDKYPENEYGTVIGSIANVRKEPGADHWIAEISFHNRLKSSNGFL